MRDCAAVIAGLMAGLAQVSPASGQQDVAPSLGDALPVILVQRVPSFPFGSWQNGVYGTVLVHYVVDTSGDADPATIRFMRAPDSLMANAVRSAVRHSRFRPGFESGRLVRVEVEQAFVFDDPQQTAVASDLEVPGTDSTRTAMDADSAETAPVVLFVSRPRLPPGMRVVGTAIAQFIVDKLGGVEPSSVKVLQSPDARVTLAIERAVRRERFKPAARHGKPVRVKVQQPITFRP